MEHYLGEKLKKLRESRGWTQADLAKRLNKAVSTISGYESDAHAIPLDVLASISSLFNILIGLTKPYIWIPFTASGLTPSQIFIYSDPSQYASTNIYTHLKIRQCEFYKDYSWQPNAFLERATIEDTTVTYVCAIKCQPIIGRDLYSL